jgi:hypothetical protein
MSGPYDQGDDDEDDGLEHLRRKHHEELTRKELLFRRAQAEKQQAHMAMQAAKILHFHSQFGDGPTHQLAKGLLVAQGPQHLQGIGRHLWHAGAQPTAKILLDHAAGAMQSEQ